MSEIISNIESELSILKVHIHNLKQENRQLKDKIHYLSKQLEEFFLKRLSTYL